jgi:4-cresol dehydrogenase (hydroxylating) flavoprotein subunit
MDSALSRWRAALPAHSVLTSRDALEAATACTFAWPRRVTAILVPENLAQVKDILRIAASTRHAVYPYGRGSNWGLGSRMPASDDCALLDLSAMNRILDYDAEHGTLTVEPGVHFAQAAAFLKQHHSDFFCSVTGGPAYGSLIGNALERGGGDGPFGDRAAHMTALELVLAGGEVVHTGFDRFAGASTARLSRTGVGPSLTELIAQSNFGVVTRATIWLARRPKVSQLVNATVASTAQLAPAIDALRLLLQNQVLYPHGATLWNSYKVAARDGHFPWESQPQLPLNLMVTEGAEPWTLSIAVEGASTAIADALLAEVRRLLAPHVQDFEVVDAQALPPSERAVLEPGNPTGQNVFSTYWRKKTALPALEDTDPDRDRCGVIWVCPSLPLDGKTVAPVVAGMEQRIRAQGFEPNLGLNPISSRLFEVYAALVYDRDVPGEDSRAMACHDTLLRWLISEGHLPYRLGVQAFGMLPEAVDDSRAVMRRIKSAFDPHNLVAPGRYAA